MLLRPPHLAGSGLLRVCKSCKNALHEGKTPSCSLANNLDWGVVPPELQDLTPMEQRSIAIYNGFTTVVRLGGSWGQFATTGGMAHIENDLATWARTLPRSPTETGLVNVFVTKDCAGLPGESVFRPFPPPARKGS